MSDDVRSYNRGRMQGAAETFRSLAANLRCGDVLTADDMDSLARTYQREADRLAAAGIRRQETHTEKEQADE